MNTDILTSSSKKNAKVKAKTRSKEINPGCRAVKTDERIREVKIFPLNFDKQEEAEIVG